MYTKYKLSKWSKLIRIRDGHICWLCEEDSTKQSATVKRRQMEAHHIKKKSDYPEEALNLDNGITLCSRCHHEIIHTTDISEKKFAYIFKRYLKRKAFREFNERYQHRLT